MGGKGGRAGNLGNGGHGGDAHVIGGGTAIGGDGGDGAVSWRPALGAPSASEHLPMGSLAQFLSRDEFGFIVNGRGGAGGNAETKVVVDGRELPLLPMLQLLRLWAPDVLSRLDAMSPSTPQDGWDRARLSFPDVATAVERHVIYCIDVAHPQGLPPPDPYKGPDGAA